MLIGTVIGNVWATKKNEQLSGCKLMIIEPLRYENHSASAPLVSVGDGSAPIDHVIVGIVDRIDLQKPIHGGGTE